jgi:hypothetical protein
VPYKVKPRHALLHLEGPEHLVNVLRFEIVPVLGVRLLDLDTRIRLRKTVTDITASAYQLILGYFGVSPRRLVPTAIRFSREVELEGQSPAPTFVWGIREGPSLLLRIVSRHGERGVLSWFRSKGMWVFGAKCLDPGSVVPLAGA